MAIGYGWGSSANNLYGYTGASQADRMKAAMATYGGQTQGVPVSAQPTGQAVNMPQPTSGPGPQQLAKFATLTPQQIASPQWQNFLGLSPEQKAQLGGVVPQNPYGATSPVNSNPTSDPRVPPTGLIGAEQALQSGLTGGLAGIEAGVNQAGQTLSPYTQGGSGAFNYAAALTGAMGQQAQQEAMSRYMEGPEQAYLREMGEKAILRNASATGGLGGGNVLQELQRHGIGLAAQDFNNSFNRLNSLGGMGLSASGQLAGLQGQGGMMGGQMAYNTGNTLAAGRTRAGEMIANNLNDTSANLANLINQQGMGMGQALGTTSGNLANFISQYGRDMGLSSQQMMTLLANIATGSGSQVAGLPSLGAMGQDPGILGGIGNVLSGAGGFMRGWNS